MRALLTALAVFLASCATTVELPAPAELYRNPVMDLDFPDPAAFLDADGWFYAYATQGTSGGRPLNIQVARSRNLVRWEHLGDALPVKPRWGSSKQKFWAPHVLHDAKLQTYIMYYSAEPDDAEGKCLAVATSATPTGPFADIGEPLLCGKGIEHIDPMAFDDPRTGKRLLYWGSGTQGIRVRELAPDRLRFAPGSAARDLILPEQGREYRSLVEGAWVIYRNDAYYLFYSGDRCCRAPLRYALMVARSNDAFGPFEPLAAPILERSAAWDAPGHNSVVTDGAGVDWILYHAVKKTPHRLMLLDRVDWRDGWPRIEGGQPSAAPRKAPAAGR